MTRFLSMFCGLLVIGCGLAAAQEPAVQDAPYQRPPRRVRPQLPAQFPSPDPASASQTVPVAPPPQAPGQTAGAKPQVAPPAPVAVAEPATPTPEQLPPPTPPHVTYRDGLLTVEAMNSTLGAVLSAIRNKTGIQFEGLEAGASERVGISMGPAPEGEILAAILGGSRFDYVVLGRPDSPGTVQRVLLTPRGGVSPTVAGAQPGRPADAQGEDDEDAPEEQASGDPDPQDTPVRPPLTQAQPPQPQPQQPDQAAPRTPEQMMQQLQQMQQRQQQQPQQQSSPQSQAPTKPPPIPQL